MQRSTAFALDYIFLFKEKKTPPNILKYKFLNLPYSAERRTVILPQKYFASFYIKECCKNNFKSWYFFSGFLGS